MAKILKWRGPEVAKIVQGNVAKAMGKFALRVEAYSKKELKHGHGVLTGTLRRSIHVAQPGYKWSGDNVEPSTSSPELGGKSFNAVVNGRKITIQVGSGLVYAMAIHQGWPVGYKNMKGSFEGYHFLTNGLGKAKPELPRDLKEFALK